MSPPVMDVTLDEVTIVIAPNRDIEQDADIISDELISIDEEDQGDDVAAHEEQHQTYFPSGRGKGDKRGW